jgi:hypothetical protein
MDPRRHLPDPALIPLLLCGLVTVNAQRRSADQPRISGSPNVQASGCTTENQSPPEELRETDYIAIGRTSCYGPCPAYTVTLQANGTVSWEGREYVTQTGPGSAYVSSDVARSIIEKFRTAGFWTLCASYDRMVTDVPTAITTLHIGDYQKSVSDRAEGAPAWLRELDYQVEALANTHRWIHGDPAVEVFQPFLHSDRSGPKPGFTALMRASADGDVAEIQKELTDGADPNAQDGSGWTALMYATLAIKPDGIPVLLRGGADPNVRSRMGQTALMAASLAFFATREKLETLLAAGARKDTHDVLDMSALDYLDNAARTWPSTRTEEYQKLRLLLR